MILPFSDPAVRLSVESSTTSVFGPSGPGTDQRLRMMRLEHHVEVLAAAVGHLVGAVQVLGQAVPGIDTDAMVTGAVEALRAAGLETAQSGRPTTTFLR